VVTRVDTDELQRLLADGAALLEVLPLDQWSEERLPGARSIPLADLDEAAVADLDHDAPVVVYGFDSECDRSARAAARLESFGFTAVHDYAPGKVAWLAAGLPSEGLRRPEQRVGPIGTTDVALVPAGATVAEAAEVVGDRDLGIVVDDDLVVLGVLRPETFGLDPATPVADVVQPGPSTFRPSMTVRELVDYFRSSNENRALVTTHTGRFLGLIRRHDVLDG
jgi:rhodanese-related sulfurtransferase/CBS domain-containing protein